MDGTRCGVDTKRAWTSGGALGTAALQRGHAEWTAWSAIYLGSLLLDLGAAEEASDVLEEGPRRPSGRAPTCTASGVLLTSAALAWQPAIGRERARPSAERTTSSFGSCFLRIARSCSHGTRTSVQR